MSDDKAAADPATTQSGAAQSPTAQSPTAQFGPVQFGPAHSLAAGEQVVLTDQRSRRYRFKLATGGEFHSHIGVVRHDDIIGQPEGSTITSGSGSAFVVLRPTLTDHVLKMPRGAQVIYPKDLAPMIWVADVSPHDRVFETGVGSGALSAALLRTGAHVTGHEIREDFAERALENLRTIVTDEALGRYDLVVRDAYEEVEGSAPYDAALLDIPEPWRVVPHLLEALRPGGRLVAYNPSVTQVIRLREVLGADAWVRAETFEVMHRSWHVEGQSVRPDHRMVAHTGFITHARRLAT